MMTVYIPFLCYLNYCHSASGKSKLFSQSQPSHAFPSFVVLRATVLCYLLQFSRFKPPLTNPFRRKLRSSPPCLHKQAPM